MVLGEAGIGKSRLVAELVGEAMRRGGRLLLGRSYESEQILPFAPWVEAFRTGGAVSPQVLESFGATWRAELGRLFPESVDTGAQPDGEADQRRLFEAIDQLLRHLAAREPVLLVLEDLHWADEMSCRLLAYVGRPAGGTAGARSGDRPRRGAGAGDPSAPGPPGDAARGAARRAGARAALTA